MSYEKNMQKLWAAYEAEHGAEPSSIDECFEWATTKGLWEPRPVDVAKLFRREMADALRNQMRTDEAGREYRAKLCVRESRGGVQLSLWGDADIAPQTFVERSVGQRRDGLVDDAFKLKMCVDHFNEFRRPEREIQLVLDLTLDVAERESLRRPKGDDEKDEAA